MLKGGRSSERRNVSSESSEFLAAFAHIKKRESYKEVMQEAMAEEKQREIDRANQAAADEAEAAAKAKAKAKATECAAEAKAAKANQAQLSQVGTTHCIQRQLSKRGRSGKVAAEKAAAAAAVKTAAGWCEASSRASQASSSGGQAGTSASASAPVSASAPPTASAAGSSSTSTTGATTNVSEQNRQPDATDNFTRCWRQTVEEDHDLCEGWGEAKVSIGQNLPKTLGLSLMEFTSAFVASGGSIAETISAVESGSGQDGLNREYNYNGTTRANLTKLLLSDLDISQNCLRAFQNNMVPQFKALMTKQLIQSGFWGRLLGHLEPQALPLPVRSHCVETRPSNLKRQQCPGKDRPEQKKLRKIYDDFTAARHQIESIGGGVIAVIALPPGSASSNGTVHLAISPEYMDGLKDVCKATREDIENRLEQACVADGRTAGIPPGFPYQTLRTLAAAAVVPDPPNIGTSSKSLAVPSPSPRPSSETSPVLLQIDRLQRAQEALDKYGVSKGRNRSVQAYYERGSNLGQELPECDIHRAILLVSGFNGFSGVVCSMPSSAAQAIHKKIDNASQRTQLLQSKCNTQWGKTAAAFSIVRALQDATLDISYAGIRAAVPLACEGSRTRTKAQVSDRSDGDHFGGLISTTRLCAEWIKSAGKNDDDQVYTLFGSSSTHPPRIARIHGICDEEARDVMTALCVHDPSRGVVGKDLNVVVMEGGSVISAHMENDPVVVTLSVTSGHLIVLSWNWDPNSEMVRHHDYNFDLLSSTCPATRVFDEKSIPPSLHEIEKGQVLALRAGVCHLVIAISDTVFCRAISWNLSDEKHVLDVYRALLASEKRSKLVDKAFLAKFISEKSDPANNAIPPAMRLPTSSLRIEVSSGFIRDIALGCRTSWLLHGEIESPRDSLVFFCCNPPPGLKGEVSVRVDTTTTHRGIDVVSKLKYTSLDGTSSWPDCVVIQDQIKQHSPASATETIIEYHWNLEQKQPVCLESLAGDHPSPVLQHVVAEMSSSSASGSAVGRGRDGDNVSESMGRPAAGDGLWTCVGCGSHAVGLVLHGCGCRACSTCFFQFGSGQPREGAPQGGCWLTNCANNYSVFGSTAQDLVNRGKVLVLPDAGRGKDVWERDGYLWAPETSKAYPLLECDSDVIEQVRTSRELPVDAIRSARGD